MTSFAMRLVRPWEQDKHTGPAAVHRCVQSEPHGQIHKCECGLVWTGEAVIYEEVL